VNHYECFYRGRRTSVQAATSYAAQQEAARFWRLSERQRPDITVVLAARQDGTPVPVDPASL
jgi:hypothetical protein